MSENMASIDDIPEGEELAPPAPTPPKRGPGHRGQDVRDTMAEMAAKAHEISLEAGSRMAGTMREVIGAAAGLTPFAIESARDLVQYMVRRGQMAQDEADKLMREVEAAHASMPKVVKPEPAKVEAPKKAPTAAAAPAVTLEPPVVPRPPKAVAPEPAKTAPKPAPAPAPAPAPVPEAAKPAKAAAPAPAPAPAPAKASAAKAPAAKAPAAKPVAKAAAAPAAKAPAKVAAKEAPKAAAKAPAKVPAKKK